MMQISPSLTMIFLDLVMIVYTFWTLSFNRPSGSKRVGFFVVMLVWLGFLHLGLSQQMFFPDDISGLAFLSAIFAGVVSAGVLLLLVPGVRKILLGMDQRQLMLAQGIRVFFGATFLMQASTGVLPQAFGIVDGFTHISAGFFGLIAAFSVAAGVQGRRRAWFANIFGLVDILVVASSLALVLLPKIGPHHPMMYAVFLPAPLWFWFHIVSIWKLLRANEPVAQLAQAE